MSETQDSYVHSVHGAYRLIASGSRWNSVEIDYGLFSSLGPNENTTPNKFPKSVDFNLHIADKAHLRRFIFISLAVVLIIIVGALLLVLLPGNHHPSPTPDDLPVGLHHSLLFFDAQKSGRLDSNSDSGYGVSYRGTSGMQDGENIANLTGGFYDSGNNIKFSFPAAYMVTLLSWSFLEYSPKYEAAGQDEHALEVIRWGSDYLLKLYSPPMIFSQVGSGEPDATGVVEDDVTCWQRPEDMRYARPVSVCDLSAADLAGEIAAAMAAASLVFRRRDEGYADVLVRMSENLFAAVMGEDGTRRVYTDAACGVEARRFYNSTGFQDELVWAATWLFFATGNTTYLDYATENLEKAGSEELAADHGAFYWNNKFPAIAILLTRLRYLLDPGYPYEEELSVASVIAGNLMCSYLSSPATFDYTPGGLILLKPSGDRHLQYAAGAVFLGKLYADYLTAIQSPFWNCTSIAAPGNASGLSTFAKRQISYILGENPRAMSYLVGFGDTYPRRVHHRGASIPADGKRHGCRDGERWRTTGDENPNVVVGAMVGGPDWDDGFLDDRRRPEYTEPTIAGNAALVAALAAAIDDPKHTGLDRNGIFQILFAKHK